MLMRDRKDKRALLLMVLRPVETTVITISLIGRLTSSYSFKLLLSVWWGCIGISNNLHDVILRLFIFFPALFSFLFYIFGLQEVPFEYGFIYIKKKICSFCSIPNVLHISVKLFLLCSTFTVHALHTVAIKSWFRGLSVSFSQSTYLLIRDIQHFIPR